MTWRVLPIACFIVSCARPAAVDDSPEPDTPPGIATLRMSVIESADPEAISIEGELVSDDGVDRSNLHLAMLWQAGCAGCGFSVDDAAVAATELNTRVAVQPLDVEGDIATSFSFHLAEPPPSFMLETGSSYYSGVVVLTESSERLEYRRDPSFREIGFSYPLLFDEDRAALRVGSMLPLYIGYAVEEGGDDINLVDGGSVGFTGPGPLSRGYHAALHDGGAVNLSVRHVVCTQALPDNFHDECQPLRDGTQEGFQEFVACSEQLDAEVCGVSPNPFETIDALSVGDFFDFTIGGADDLIRALVGLTLEEFT